MSLQNNNPIFNGDSSGDEDDNDNKEFEQHGDNVIEREMSNNQINFSTNETHQQEDVELPRSRRSRNL